jgi:hypothetical protein
MQIEEQNEIVARGEKAAVRWLRILQGIRRKVNSIAANGGMVSMTATWSPKRVESLLKELGQLESRLKNIRDELNNKTKMEAKMTKKTKKQDKPEPIERIKVDPSEYKREPPVTLTDLKREPVEFSELKRIGAVKDENAPKTPFEKKQERVLKRLAG